jgi:hypothetical protein
VLQAGGCCPEGNISTPISDILDSLLSIVRNDVVTLGLLCLYILILSPISALMSATISVYILILSPISALMSDTVSYDILDVSDIVGAKNRVGLKIRPDIGVLTPISEVKTRYHRWQEQGILYRVPDIGVFTTISDLISELFTTILEVTPISEFVPVLEFALILVLISKVLTPISEQLLYQCSETGFYSHRCSSKRSAQ